MLQAIYDHHKDESDNEAKERVVEESYCEDMLIGRIPLLSEEKISHAALKAIMELDVFGEFQRGPAAGSDLENIMTRIFKLGYEFCAKGGRCNLDK